MMSLPVHNVIATTSSTLKEEEPHVPSAHLIKDSGEMGQTLMAMEPISVINALKAVRSVHPKTLAKNVRISIKNL
jgi:hypothetical protein